MRACLIQAARAAVRPVLGAHGYALVYGSHACGRAGPSSDLDLLVVTPDPLRTEHLRRLGDQVRQLHHDHGLDLDEEVRYEVKLHATWAEVLAATSLSPFRTATGLAATTIAEDQDYLNSAPFKHRLILNALTSPHVLLSGDRITYQCHRAAAVVAVTILGRALTGPSTGLPGQPDIEDVVAALTRAGDGGATGKDFLGYQVPGALATPVRAGLAFLASLEQWQDAYQEGNP